MKTWAIVNENDDYITLDGVSTDYYKAVGILYTKFTDCIDRWVHDGQPAYKLIEKEEWCRLEADSGWGFFATLECELENGHKITINERWYLLEYDEDNQ